MNYDHIEKLALEARQGNEKAKETLVSEFTPLILKLSKKAYIDSYDFEDIKNECYKALFKCVLMYDPKAHRFVAYATTAIKNSVNHLIRTSIRRKGAEGQEAYILDSKLFNILCSSKEHTDHIVINRDNIIKLKAAIKALDPSEQELISLIYFKGYSLKRYSELTGISYYAAANSKAGILNKLEKALKLSSKTSYLN